ncbi:MAG: sigma-70 family RNA polymerase sigma factor [Acidimicrobiia bacterium]|nr:sigma-70 family RNA polymerase sigma factor [Acidimicrobiia bacterium]
MNDSPSIDVAALPGRLAADLDAAFPDVVRALQDDVFSGALRMTRDRHAAEDIAQEAFARGYRALRTYDAERIRALALRGWIWTIAANLCRNRARSRSRRPESPLADRDVADEAASPESVALASEGPLAALVGGLPWPQRAGVVLRHVVGLSYEEIADALDRPVGTVKSDVHRGLAALRSHLEVQP